MTETAVTRNPMQDRDLVKYRKADDLCYALLAAIVSALLLPVWSAQHSALSLMEARILLFISKVTSKDSLLCTKEQPC